MMDIIQAAPSRSDIDRLEGHILTEPQVNFETTHALSGGMYARTITIPAGVVLTGAAHKKDHLNIMRGDITVWTEAGMQRLTGQHVLPTKAGAKRVGFAHSETLWTTICATELTDLAAIESELVEEPEKLQTRNPAIGCASLVKIRE
jgi:hypothetical protein